MGKICFFVNRKISPAGDKQYSTLLIEEQFRSLIKRKIIMSKKISPLDNHANQQNSNKGTSNFNNQYKAVMDNRSRQLNPNNPLYKEGKK